VLISDVLFTYKADWNGTKVIIADRYFPSSKMCHVCGNINHDLKLKDRIWTCPACGTVLDRDINAAINLKKEGVRQVLSEHAQDKLEQNACGEIISPVSLHSATKQAVSEKQELSSDLT